MARKQQGETIKEELSSEANQSRKYSSGKIDWFRIEDLKSSEQAIGQIYPVIKNAKGDIIDGMQRKRVDPDWKEVIIPIQDDLESLKFKIHLNIMRHGILGSEKNEWVQNARKLIQDRGLKGTHKQIAEALAMGEPWVKKWDPVKHQDQPKRSTPYSFLGYNVWGFKGEDWRKLIVAGDPNQPSKEGYHGYTPAFIIHQLVSMYQPKRVLDSMAGLGSTGYVCAQHNIQCDQFDLYPYQGVLEGDAESVQPHASYDLIFNHIPYLNMVKYGDHTEDMSVMNEARFYEKLRRIFRHNFELLNPDGVYALLVGDWRSGGQLKPVTATSTLIGIEIGFILQDAAIKLTGEMQSKTLQEYRASVHGYLAQTYDTVLMFKKVEA